MKINNNLPFSFCEHCKDFSLVSDHDDLTYYLDGKPYVAERTITIGCDDAEKCKLIYEYISKMIESQTEQAPNQSERERRRHTTKPQFTQRWQHAEALALHAWRCYINRPEVTVDVMSQASYLSWAACNTVWNQLTQNEKDVLSAFFTNRFAKSDYCTRQVINKALKMWAMERGLADE